MQQSRNAGQACASNSFHDVSSSLSGGRADGFALAWMILINRTVNRGMIGLPRWHGQANIHGNYAFISVNKGVSGKTLRHFN
jgi:hypothetical protein